MPSSDPQAPPSPLREPRLPAPQPYDGAPGTCRSFLSQCSLSLERQSLAFPTECSCIAYVITLLTGKTREWGTALWDAKAACCSKYKDFTDEMRKVFDRSFSGREAAREIMKLCQGSQSDYDYAIDFHTLAASCGWNDDSLFDAFLNGLSDPVKDELASRELPKDLAGLMDLTGRVDARLRQRAWERTRSPPRLSPSTSPSLTAPPPEPMQVNRARITPEEHQRRREVKACFYRGHFCQSCPLKGASHQ